MSFSNDLIKAKQSGYKKFLVFTSAGDNANIKYWVDGVRDYDLFVVYYGDAKNYPFKDISDYYVRRKGAKFPNLKYIFDAYPEILERYDAIYVSDDDIIITTQRINMLYRFLLKYELEILQPSFRRSGKVSFWHNLAKPFSTLTYTNFIEVACPMFTQKTLSKFLENYDPTVIGWGVDWWFSQNVTNSECTNKLAVIDCISCINPKDEKKAGSRDIDALQSSKKRQRNWERVAKDRRLLDYFEIAEERLFDAQQKFSIKYFFRSILIWTENAGYLVTKRILGQKVFPTYKKGKFLDTRNFN